MSKKDQKKETTEIICIIDRSTSIRTSNLIEKTIEGFNAFKAEQEKVPGKAVMTVCLFDGQPSHGGGNLSFGEPYEIIHEGVKIKDVPDLNDKTFVPKGWTAMYDAIGITIEGARKRISDMKKKDRPDKVIVLIMTDGEENSSKDYNKASVAKLVKEVEAENWAVIFLGANIDAMAEAASLNMSVQNSASFKATPLGVQTAYASVNTAVTHARGMSASDYKEKKDSLMSDSNN